MEDTAHIERIIAEYKRIGFLTAIDDFGSGYAGLNLLANFQPDMIKIDMDIIRNIDTSPARQAIVAAIGHIARTLDITIIAEGIENRAEFEMLRAAGIELFQGFYFAKPGIETLPKVPFLAGPPLGKAAQA
jgi:EAL domain-containing protein (putative c-di-GMP-specific phosphodiesterase class I)